MLDLVSLENYSMDGFTHQKVYALLLEGVPLVNINAYLFHKAKSNKKHALRNKAQHLKSFLSQVLTDYNEWSFLKDDLNNGSKNRYVVASKAYLNVSDEYISGYLKRLARGSAKFSKGKPLESSSITQHIEAIKDFYKFSYEYGFTFKKKNYSWLFDQYNQKKTVTVGLNKAIHDLYYDKNTFLSVIGHIQTRNNTLKCRNLIILKLCYFCGLRPYEIIHSLNFSADKLKEKIKKDTSELSSVELLILGKGKGVGKIRKVVLTPEVIKDIKKYLYKYIPAIEKDNNIKIKGNIFVTLKGVKLKDSSFFNDKLWKSMVNAYISNNDLDIYEIEAWKKRYLYTTRHCFATNLIIERRKEGKSLDQIAIKEIMGHTRFDTTLASYIYLAAILTMDKKLESLAIEMADRDVMQGKFSRETISA